MIETIHTVILALQRLEITGTKTNLNNLLGAIQALEHVAAELEERDGRPTDNP